MNIITNTKKTKKFILILVVLLLFNFCCPKTVNADLGDDIVAAPAKIFWAIADGVLRFLNNLFTSPRYHIYKGGTTSIVFTPENIIKGKFILFDANIFNEIESDTGWYYDYSAHDGDITDGKIKLRDTIAGWYYALRNFAIVALLSVLLYVGIRMLISTIAQDKAKYKIMFKDWLVALCLVVLMHYAMIAILDISTLITESLGGGRNAGLYEKTIPILTSILADGDDDDDDGTCYQITYDGTEYSISDAYAYILVILGIIIYTFIFAVKYLKREFTIIFLILLGPVSCITYPIDKISDGKAQAYNKWFSEFLFQVIIQPFHLLLYIVLIGTAVEMANANIIYTIICFAVMSPAEKFVKEMFGFRDKLGSPLGAAAAGGALGSLAGKAIHALTSKKGGHTGGNNGGNQQVEKGDSANSLPPKTVDRNDLTDGGETNDSAQPKLNEKNPTDDGDESAKRKMLDVDYEDFGSPDYDPHETAYLENDFSDKQPGYNGTEDERRQAIEDAYREQGLNDDEIAEEMKSLGYNNENETPQAENSQTEKVEPEQEADEKTSAWAKAKSKYNERVVNKYGTTDKKQIWKRRAGRALKATGKGALGIAKVGTVGMLGAVGTGAALLTGNGKEALGIASGVLAYAGKTAISGGAKAIKGATGYVKGAAKDYGNLYRDDISGKIPFIKSTDQKKLDAFKSDPAQIQKAIASYKDKHGKGPSNAALNQEMEDRFMLSSYGLTDDQINKYLPTYQNDVKRLSPPKLEKGANKEQKQLYAAQMARAKEIAASQAKYTAELSGAYSGKDYRDTKVMSAAHERIKEGLMKDTGCDELTASNYATKYLTEAGKMKSVPETEIALPSTTLKGSNNSKDQVSEMKIKVKEGKVNIQEDKPVNQRINAKLEYQENTENNRILADNQRKEAKSDVEVNVDSNAAKDNLKQVGRRRELNKATETQISKTKTDNKGLNDEQKKKVTQSKEVDTKKKEIAKDSQKQIEDVTGKKKI